MSISPTALFLFFLLRQLKASSFNDMILLGSKYRKALHNFKETALQGQSATVDGLSYQVVSNYKLLKITNEIRSSLDLPEFSHLSREQKEVNSNEEIH